MGCFLVPVAEALVVTAIKKNVEKNELKAEVVAASEDLNSTSEKKLPWSQKLGWLNKMLWGGSALLALEHVWHGEIVPVAPFLTALSNPADIGPMLYEMATVGTTMTVGITAIWAIMVLVAEHKVKKAVIEA